MPAITNQTQLEALDSEFEAIFMNIEAMDRHAFIRIRIDALFRLIFCARSYIETQMEANAKSILNHD